MFFNLKFLQHKIVLDFPSLLLHSIVDSLSQEGFA